MGWLYTPGQTRSALIERLTRPQSNDIANNTTIAYCVRGNVLWSIRETTFHHGRHGYLPGFPIRYIGCDLMASHRGFGWGYKDLDERSHPFYYHCPLSYLDRVPETNPDWRAAVREWHARVNRELNIGEVWQLRPGFAISAVEIMSLRPLRARGLADGVRYRIKQRFLERLIDDCSGLDANNVTQLELLPQAA